MAYWGYCSLLSSFLKATDAGCLEWVIFSFSHIAFSHVNMKVWLTLVLICFHLCPAYHSNPFEISSLRLIKCSVSIIWYLISLICNNYFINLLILTFVYLGCIFLTAFILLTLKYQCWFIVEIPANFYL